MQRRAFCWIVKHVQGITKNILQLTVNYQNINNNYLEAGCVPGEVWAHPEDELVMDGALAAHTQRRGELHACKYVRWKKILLWGKWNFSDTITVSEVMFTSGTLLQRRVTSLDTFYFSIISAGATHSSVALSDGDSRSQDVCQWPLLILMDTVMAWISGTSGWCSHWLVVSQDFAALI